MSLLQEMEKFGLADCAFNRAILANNGRFLYLLDLWVSVYNEHQTIEGDDDLCLTPQAAIDSPDFLYWCNVWNEDSRGNLAFMLEQLKENK
jgi:hypothetical protein